MRGRTRSILGACLLALLAGPATGKPGAGESRLRKHVEYLASEELEGRLTGTPGSRKAADYIAGRLESWGAKPLPGADSMLLPFEFTAGSKDTGSEIEIEGGGEAVRYRGTERVQALSFSDSGAVSGGVVFAGYGLTVPDEDFGYDSYAGLDVEGKIVVVLRYFPEDADTDTRALLARYSGLRYKALQARERGAAAIVVVTGPRSPNAGRTVRMTFDSALSGSGIVAASLGGEAVEALFSRADGKSLEELQAALDTANPHVTGFELPGVTLRLDVKVERTRRTGYNVVGHLPPTEQPGAGRPWLLIGAHFDHLGRGGSGNSLAKQDEEDHIHFGADDNASGVAAVLEVARAATEARRRHPLAFAFWSGEELGLLGSDAFLKSGAVPAEDIAAYLNLDMVGRMRDNRLQLQGAGSSSVWPGLVERANVRVGVDARVQQDPWLPTDAAAFYRNEIPVLSMFTGSHTDYHRPTDVADKLNYEDLVRVRELAGDLLRRLDRLEERPDYVVVQRSAEQGGSRDTLRAYTGTIPDYSTEVEGLLLSGVSGGGPAEKAGMRGGDVVVEFCGRAIKNIYDYTYALDAVKVGESCEVVVLRGEERVSLTIVPTARP